MSAHSFSTPDSMPVLSRGKHRSPRSGACFMELASYLAGERWSDHPACTHPLLARVARLVNDATSDDGRGRLAVLIPAVIGMTSDDPRVDARVALRSARTALPVVAAERQRVMAVAVLTCERMLGQLEGRAAGSLEPASRAALAEAPHAARWAMSFSAGGSSSPKRFRRRVAPHIVTVAVTGTAHACIPDRDGVLYDLLSGAIEECRAMIQAPADVGVVVDAPRWADVCALTDAAQRR